MRIFVVVVLLTLALAGSVQASEPAGDVRVVLGTVTVLRGNTRLVPVVGDTLQVQDSIQTGADGSIGISFVDGTRLSLGPSSEVALQEYLFEPLDGDFAFALQMVRGTAAYVTGKLGALAPTAVKISTPQATIGIRGTYFVLKVE